MHATFIAIAIKYSLLDSIIVAMHLHEPLVSQ